MSKTAKTLIILISISLLLAIFIVFSSELIVIDKEAGNFDLPQNAAVEKKAVDLELLAKEYEEEAGKIFSGIEELSAMLAASSSAPADMASTSSEPSASDREIKASLLKTRLIDLTVPEQYKNMHVGMILVLEKLEEHISSGDERYLEEAQDMIAGIKLEFDQTTGSLLN